MIIDFQRIKLQINIFNCQTFKITQGGGTLVMVIFILFWIILKF